MRMMLIGLLVMTGAAMVAAPEQTAQPGQMTKARVWIENVLQFGALLTGILSRNKRVNLAALTILIGVYLYSAVMSFIQPVPL